MQTRTTFNLVSSYDAGVSVKRGSGLQEQINGAANAPNTIDGDQAVALARQTSSNFVIAIVQAGFSAAKRALGDEFLEAWRRAKTGAYGVAGIAIISEYGAIIDFVVRYIDELSSFIGSAIRNPTVSQILDFIVKVFS